MQNIFLSLIKMILLIFLEINKLKLINNTIWFGQWLLKAVKNATEWITPLDCGND